MLLLCAGGDKRLIGVGLRENWVSPRYAFTRVCHQSGKGILLSHSSEPGVLSYKTRAQSPAASETANRKVKPLNLGIVLNSHLGLEMLAAQILPQEIRWTSYWVYYGPVSQTTVNNLACIFMQGACLDNKHNRLRSQYCRVKKKKFCLKFLLHGSLYPHAASAEHLLWCCKHQARTPENRILKSTLVLIYCAKFLISIYPCDPPCFLQIWVKNF